MVLDIIAEFVGTYFFAMILIKCEFLNHDLKKGDLVQTFIGWEEIECIVKTPSNSLIDLVQIDDLLVTPWHPIKINNKWVFPQDIGNVVKINCPAVYSFVLKNRHNMIINDTICSTLGHNLRGDVIEHPFYGTNQIINKLKTNSDWNTGLITLDNYRIEKDPKTNMVCNIHFT